MTVSGFESRYPGHEKILDRHATALRFPVTVLWSLPTEDDCERL